MKKKADILERKKKLEEKHLAIRVLFPGTMSNRKAAMLRHEMEILQLQIGELDWVMEQKP